MKRRHFLLLSAGLLAGCQPGRSASSHFAMTLGGAYSAALSENGRLGLIGSIEHGASLWDLRQAERLFDWNHQANQITEVTHAGFSPDGDFAVTATPIELALWQTSNGQGLSFWRAPSEILDLAVSTAGNFALLGLASHEAVLFDVKNGGIRRTLAHPARVRSVALSRDNRLAVTGCDDYQARIWNLQTGEMIASQGFDNLVNCVAISPDSNNLFCSATLAQARILRSRDAETLHALSGQERFIKRRLSFLCARFSNDNQQLLTGTASGSVLLWDVSSGALLKQWQLTQQKSYGPVSTGVYDVAFASEGDYLAIGSNGLLNRFS